MDREQKKKSAEELHEELAKARGIILSGFQGITVSQDFELRRKVAGTGARYKVVKNTPDPARRQGDAGRAHCPQTCGNDLRGSHRR